MHVYLRVEQHRYLHNLLQPPLKIGRISIKDIVKKVGYLAGY